MASEACVNLHLIGPKLHCSLGLGNLSVHHMDSVRSKVPIQFDL